MNLAYDVMEYFRFKRNCTYVIDEVGAYNADVLVIDKDYLIEIECKISISDLKADLKKREKHQLYSTLEFTFFDYKTNSDRTIKATSNLQVPNKLFYCVPVELEEKAKEILEKSFNAKYGLLRAGNSYIGRGKGITVAKHAQWLHKDKVEPFMKDTIAKRAINKLFTNIGKCRYCTFNLSNELSKIKAKAIDEILD